MSDSITIKANGREMRGFTALTITRGLEKAVSSCDLSTVYPKSTANFYDLIPFNLQDLITVYIGDDLVFSGYVIKAPFAYNQSAATIKIAAMSKPVDLTDCSCNAVAYNDVSIGYIIKDTLALIGIEGVFNADLSDKLPTFNVTIDDTPLSVFQKLLQHKNIYIFDDAHGRLVFGKQAPHKHARRLVGGQNILSATFDNDISNLFTHYIVTGQDLTGLMGGSTAYAPQVGQVTDPDIKRGRVKHFTFSGSADQNALQTRANQIFNYRKARTATLTVLGYRDADGLLWQAGDQVYVDDARAGVSSWFDIVDVTYSLSNDGKTTKLVLKQPYGDISL